MARRRSARGFGQTVKDLRQRHGLSQTDLARLLWDDNSITHEHDKTKMISRWENGHQQPHSMGRSHLDKLARELDDKRQASSGDGDSKPTRRPVGAVPSTADTPSPAPSRASGGLLPSVS